MASALIILCLFVLSATEASNANCANKENCNAEDGHLAVLSCKGGSCTCTPDPESETYCDGLNMIDIQTAEGCKTYCKDNATDCVFYKFEKFAPIIGSWCYLMGGDQCNGPSSEMCEELHCQSGVADDSVCEPEDPISCPLGETEEEGLVFDDYKVHWFCYDSNDSNNPGKVDVYMETQAPEGTVCTTTHKCNQFDGDSEILQYKCFPKANKAGEGEWRDLAGAEVAGPGLSNDGRLVEPGCDCDPLTLDKTSFSQEGLMIQCTKEPVDEATPSIPAPNHCLLLCDYYSVLHIFTDWKPDVGGVEVGEQDWWYRLVSDPDDGQHDFQIDQGNIKDIVRCWE